MADNVAITPGSGGTIASDEIAGAQYQRVKLISGADGVNNGDIASGNPLPVDIKSALPAGTNNIGDVDVLTQPARDRLTDNIGVALQTDALLNDTTVLTPKFAVISASTSGDNTLVAAVVGKKIRVLSYCLVCAAAVMVRFEAGVAGPALSGQMEFAANSGIAIIFSPVGHFETSVNTLLNLELSGAVSVAGHLTYVEV